jgi:hypothetical protein
MRRKFFTCSGLVEDVHHVQVLLAHQRYGFRFRKVQFSISPGHVAQGIHREIHVQVLHPVESMLSGVWKSTGVTMVTRFHLFRVQWRSSRG